MIKSQVQHVRIHTLNLNLQVHQRRIFTFSKKTERKRLVFNSIVHTVKKILLLSLELRGRGLRQVFL